MTAQPSELELRWRPPTPDWLPIFLGGALMVGMGLMLAKESGLDALAWYGAQYPFEIVLTTVFTGGAAG